MPHQTAKVRKIVLFTIFAMILLCGNAFAKEGDIVKAVGCTNGTGVRLRSAASTSSDILSELNIYTAVGVLDDSNSGWVKVSYNGHVGYISTDFFIFDKDNQFETYGVVCGNTVNVRSDAKTSAKSVVKVNKGTILDVLGLKDGWYFVETSDGKSGYIRSDFVDLVETIEETKVEEIVELDGTLSIVVPSDSSLGTSIYELAKQYKGVRYVYGGASPKGFDCSGFTMYICKQFGISLPHTATGQWQSGVGTKVSSISNLQVGDLVFFCDPARCAGKACSHAGFYAGNGQIIHASSSKAGVVYSDLTSGYYNRYYVGGIHLS